MIIFVSILYKSNRNKHISVEFHQHKLLTAPSSLDKLTLRVSEHISTRAYRAVA